MAGPTSGCQAFRLGIQDGFEIHTNFANTATIFHAFDLARLAEPANLDILRKLFTDPDALKPGETTEAITRHVAERFKELADGFVKSPEPGRR